MEFATIPVHYPPIKCDIILKIYCRWDSQHCQRKIAIVPCAVDLINFTECTERKKTDCWRLNIRLNKRCCQTISSKIISVISADRLHELVRGGRDAVVLDRRKKKNISQRVHRNAYQRGPKRANKKAEWKEAEDWEREESKKASPRVRVSDDNKSGTRWSSFRQTLNIFPAIMMRWNRHRFACSSQ